VKLLLLEQIIMAFEIVGKMQERRLGCPRLLVSVLWLHIALEARRKGRKKEKKFQTRTESSSVFQVFSKRESRIDEV
jgi:hypothetical protein